MRGRPLLGASPQAPPHSWSCGGVTGRQPVVLLRGLRGTHWGLGDEASGPGARPRHLNQPDHLPMWAWGRARTSPFPGLGGCSHVHPRVHTYASTAQPQVWRVVCPLGLCVLLPTSRSLTASVSRVADGSSSRKAGQWFPVKASENPHASLTELAENGLSCCPRIAVSLPHHGDHALHRPPRPCPHIRFLLAAWMSDLRDTKEGNGRFCGKTSENQGGKHAGF